MTTPEPPQPLPAGAPRPPERGWRPAAIALALLTGLAAALGAAAYLGRLPAPPKGLQIGAAPAPVADTTADHGADAPPPWAIPPPPPPAKAASTRAPAAAPAARPGAHPPSPAAYPPGVEDAIHAALESGAPQRWSALGVDGWVTVSTAGGPDRACRSFRVVRETGASAPQVLCRAPDGRWRPR